MNQLLNILIKSIISVLGIIIFFLYFFFEEKNDFFSSSSSKDDEKNRNTNFTKITKNLYNFYVVIVIIFLTILFFLPEGLIEKPELKNKSELMITDSNEEKEINFSDNKDTIIS
ncbi:MAG: Large-conductance mechanosensitive channel [Mycoplasmataceae bacterium]|nr:MAG: Large-conductance mechanosensitive channel [Mycoplasmataceae bacterium]